MSAGTSASLCMTLVSVVLSVSAGHTTIRTVPGQTVSLPCKALNNDPVRVVEWRRTDMEEEEYVLIYRDNQSDPENQHQSYKNRVDLQDRQMKDGDVSLILNNVKTEDSGTYECYVVQRKLNQERSIIIRLEVVPPGHTDGHKEDGGDKDGSVVDSLTVGLIVGVLLLLLGVAGFLIFRIRKPRYHPPHE